LLPLSGLATMRSCSSIRWTLAKWICPGAGHRDGLLTLLSRTRGQFLTSSQWRRGGRPTNDRAATAHESFTTMLYIPPTSVEMTALYCFNVPRRKTATASNRICLLWYNSVFTCWSGKTLFLREMAIVMILLCLQCGLYCPIHRLIWSTFNVTNQYRFK